MVQQPKLEQTAEGWDGAVDHYESTVERITSRFAGHMLDRLDIGAGTKLLDVASGAGVVAVGAARRGADVLATDFSSKMVERLQQRLIDDGAPQVKTKVMDGQALDLPDGSMDVVTSNFGVMFFPDPAKGFSEMCRVLRSNGAAAVSTWGPRERNGLQLLIGEAIQRVRPNPDAASQPTQQADLSNPDFFRDQLLSAGFASVEITTLSEPWVFDPGRSIEGFIASNPATKPLLAQFSHGERQDFIEALVSILEERAEGGPPTLHLEAHIAVARKG